MSLTYQLMLPGITKIHTDLLWLLTIIFCVIGALYFVFVFFFRNKISKRAKLVAIRKKELAPMISQFLFYEPDSSLEESKEYLNQKVEIREMVKSKFNRSVLSEILMDLQKDVSGDARNRLYELYTNLGLHQDAYTKLKNWRWEIVSQGILELTQMRVEDSYMFIRRFINHRKGVIRKQAQIATVSLKHEGIAYFLDTCRFQISEWQQLKLLDVLRHLEDFDPPKFKVWLTSKNKDVVLFSLRLIRYYKQNDANPAIEQLIKHRNSHIKTEAIQCLKEFGASEAINTLKTSFRKCNTEVKIAILDAIGILGSETDIDFLKKVERSDDSFTVKSKALTAINTIDPDYIVPSENIVEPSAADLRYAEDVIPHEPPQKAMDPEDAKKEEEVIPATTELEKNQQAEIAEYEIEEKPEEIIEDKEEVVEDKKKPIEEEFIPELNALDDENEILFDICFREELRDILEEAKPQADVEYLPLNFLPVVEIESDSDTENEPEPATAIDSYADEESFKEELDNILNKIAMKDDSYKSGTEDEIPEFLPKVVENEVEAIKTELGLTLSDDILDLDVEADVVGIEAEPSISVNEQNLDSGIETFADILETEVEAEIIKWPEWEEERVEIETKPESSEHEELNAEELLGFSIFQEMFRDFDSESKLILLDEILVVGEEKELIFLDTLSADPDKKVRNKARKIRNQLADKLKAAKEKGSEENSAQNLVIGQEAPAKEPNATAIEKEENEAIETEQKLPLEFCFFENAEEILGGQIAFEPQLELRTEEEESLESQSGTKQGSSDSVSPGTSIIDSFIAFSSKLRERFNG